ncbi:hypothetical protein [Planococcus sp. PAMC 21323]|uniref:hypothetical protein n=1 Tax=Planococcus sp. PAMC 21323 TaxID=1526927 RepID=UPI00056DDC0F|nr:hypothetical protein [Planococcus sp. PAMC 21323]
MYKVILYLSVVILISFIIWVGVESLPVKVALAIIGLTFLPKTRKKLYKPLLVIRKGKVAFYASLLFTFLLLIFDIKTVITGSSTDFIFSIFVLSSCLLGNIIYGIPVSLLADLVTTHVRKYRVYLSFLVHIGFGLLSFFFLGPLMVLAAFMAILFFLIDEFLRKREGNSIPFEI